MTKKRILITGLQLMELYAEIDRKYMAPFNSTAQVGIGGYTPEYLELMKSQEQSQDVQDKTDDQ